MVSIGEAGNTLYPSLYIILKKGYAVEMMEPDVIDDNSPNLFVAKKEDNQFISDNFLSLLGLISIWENLGDNTETHIPLEPEM
jgi:hypothetical protein